MKFSQNFVLLVALMVSLFLLAHESEARPSMDKDENGGEMSDALKYLDELDKYYSQVTRPRLEFHLRIINSYATFI